MRDQDLEAAVELAPFAAPHVFELLGDIRQIERGDPPGPQMGDLLLDPGDEVLLVGTLSREYGPHDPPPCHLYGRWRRSTRLATRINTPRSRRPPTRCGISMFTRSAARTGRLPGWRRWP